MNHWIVSQAWSLASWIMRAASRHEWIRPVSLGPRVISVGNIQAGGTGKTPLVARIAREAHLRNQRVCILIRGYRSSWEKGGGVLGPGERADPELCGDEAALLHELVPWAWIGVGRDRIRVFKKVEVRTPIDCVILDDGFQNRKIKKDIEVVAVTSASTCTAYFREYPSALFYSDLLVWTKGDLPPTSYGKPVVQAEFKVSAPKGPLWLVTGVGDPANVKAVVEKSGAQVSRHFVYPDHARYSREEVENLVNQARKAGAKIVLTGKDRVKWQRLGISEQEFLALEPEVIFTEGEPIWQKMLWDGS